MLIIRDKRTKGGLGCFITIKKAPLREVAFRAQ